MALRPADGLLPLLLSLCLLLPAEGMAAAQPLAPAAALADAPGSRPAPVFADQPASGAAFAASVTVSGAGAGAGAGAAEASLAPADGGRPRVALVLSGGGARGLAHVGVFKALEQLRIPYDCIVGTSMGAIAGGALASGTSLEVAEKKVVDADWEGILAGRTKRFDIPYFRKSEDERPYFNFDLTLADFKPVTPRNFVGVQNIALFFRELTGARSADSFDELPIPFRAVGTDIITGEAVVIDSGSVADAMRASMTVPGLFAPYRHDGHLIVDGGLATNLPVGIGQQLCGEVVIAVNVSSPNLRAEQLDSFFSIGEQVINISMMQKLDQELVRLRPRDVLLMPDLDDLASTEFERAHDIIARGEAAVLSQAMHLRELQVSEADYTAWRAAVVARRPPRPVVETVTMADMRWVNPEVMSDLLRLRPGMPFDLAALHRNISKVYARGDFTQISYELVETAPGRAELRIAPEERPGRDFMRFGLGLYTDFQGDGRFTATASLRRAWLNRLDGQWRTDLEVGRDFNLQSEWYQPASLGSELFLAPQVFYNEQHRDLRFSSETRFGYEYTRTGAALEIGSVLGRFGEIRAGATYAYATTRTQAGPIIPEGGYHQGGFTLRSVYDQLDSVYFPHEGGAARVNYFASRGNFGADLRYDRLDVSAKRALTRGRTTVQVNLRAASSLDTTLPFYDAFGLGGLFNLSAYPPDYFLGNEVVSGGLLLYRQVSTLPAALGRGVYAGTALEAGRMTGVLPGYAAPDEALSGGLFLAADTVLGPFYLLGAVGDRQQRALYLALGVSF
ncbi:MAG: Patatin [Moraxellaceae bacterium]|nr:Patatin [Moraxellaceae bacterium]